MVGSFVAFVSIVLVSPTAAFHLSSNLDDNGMVLSLGCHHKTGTHLLGCLQGAWQSLLWESTSKHGTEKVTSANRHDRLKSNSRRYQCLDAQAYALLKADSKYRLVHVVREPLNTVISGYLYHRNHTDTQMVRNTGPTVLGSLTLEEGLNHEAKSEIESTLQEMRGVVAITSGDRNVTTISLEDFVDDFDGTVAFIFDFLFGRGHPLKHKMCRKATKCDSNRFPDQEPGHISSKEDYVKVMATIDQSQDPVWAEVRGFRQDLGFVEVIPGRWRIQRNTRMQVGGAAPLSRPENDFAAADAYDY